MTDGNAPFLGWPMRARQAAAALGFLAAVVAGLWVCDFILGSGALWLLKQSRNRFSMLYAGRAETDILILGNSRAVNAFYAPEIRRRTGRRCFNLAYNGVSAEVAECLFNDYLDRHAAPELVLAEATLTLAEPGVAVKLLPFAGESPCLSALLEREFPGLGAPARWSRLYRCNSEFFLRSFAYMSASDQGWHNGGLLTEAKKRALRRQAPQWLRDAPENVEAMRRILGTCRRRGIPAAVIMGPTHPEARRVRANGAQWVEEERAFCEGQGAAFFDYSEFLDGDDAAFADGIHINLKGSLLLLGRMEEDGIFAPTDGDLRLEGRKR